MRHTYRYYTFLRRLRFAVNWDMYISQIAHVKRSILIFVQTCKVFSSPLYSIATSPNLTTGACLFVRTQRNCTIRYIGLRTVERVVVMLNTCFLVRQIGVCDIILCLARASKWLKVRKIKVKYNV